MKTAVASQDQPEPSNDYDRQAGAFRAKYRPLITQAAQVINRAGQLGGRRG